MADGNLVRQSNVGEGSMVFGPTVCDVPLLPYEKELIKTIGITEEEYRKFTEEAKRRGAVRPAEYAGIPDIKNAAAVPILINLAIGLVLTGIAYLLTPKPKMPSAQRREGGVIDLASVTGANRFTPSRGFETLAELADYASPVPLIFGLYKDGIGGMLVTPKLVWSRMFSHGSMQRAKLMFVVGEQGIAGSGIQPPDLRGIFLGNNALDTIFEDSFAFYWKADSSTTFRIRGSDKIYGTRGDSDTGDPDVNSGNAEAFLCPTPENQQDQAFCHAYSPANSTQFGVYGAIANGTNYRVNYRVVSIPVNNDNNKSRKAMARQTLSRIKIVGEFDPGDPNKGPSNRDPGDLDPEELNEIREFNQAGAGRNYSPRMGLTEVNQNGTIYTVTSGLRLTVNNISVGDKAVFLIKNNSIDTDFYSKNGIGESVEDINSAVEAMQVEADSAMQLGEQFEIGGCIWKVTKRKIERFDPLQDEDQRITLKCIDTSSSVYRRIGIVSESEVVNPSHEYIGDSGNGATGVGVGEGFYPITKVSIATIRNNRPAVTTEIGLKSTVFQRLNGLCAFNSLPSPSVIEESDEDQIQINTGTINASIVRSTVFRVFIRNVDSDTDVFNAYPRYFLVRGQRPVAQYNYIRFTNDTDIGVNGEAVLEFKFVQVSGSELRDLPSNTIFIELSQLQSTDSQKNGRSGFVTETKHVPNVGNITLNVAGRLVGTTNSGQSWKDALAVNREFGRKANVVSGDEEVSYPASATFYGPLPDAKTGRIVEIGSELTRRTNIANLSTDQGKLGAFFYELAGSAGDPGTGRVGDIRRFRSKEFINGSTKTWLYLEWRLEKKRNEVGFYARQLNGERFGWKFVSVKVLGSGGGFTNNSELEIKRGSEATNVLTGQTDYQDTNPYVANHPDGDLRYSGAIFQVNATTEDVVLPARSQSYLYDLFGDTAGFADGETKTITKILTKGSKSIKADLTVTARTFTESVVGNLRGWTIPKLTKIYQDANTTKDWNVGDRIKDRRTISTDNPFYTVYDDPGQEWEIGEVTVITQPSVIDAELFFAQQTQITDISQYREYVDKSNSDSPEHEIVYVNEIQRNEFKVNMNDLTLAGLSLKASRNFTSLDQMRCWLSSGMNVERLHPRPNDAYGDTNAIGPSNLFTDLVYFLFTDQLSGAGGLLAMNSGDPYLVDKDELIKTSRFLEKQKLFFNGPIVERTNLSQYITSIAPYFLCNFIITDGKFSLKPAVPVRTGGDINDRAVPIDQLFTSGNILEDTFKLEYLATEERRVFKAVIRYRQERANKLPEERAITIKGTDGSGNYADPGVDLLPEEQFDLTQFCTSEDHAIMAGKYMLALRAFVTHTISFSTTAEGLNVKAGSYIKVITESSPYSSANNGTISSSGVVTSVSPLEDGFYRVDYFKTGKDDIETGQMQVSNGIVSDSTFHDSVFTVRVDSNSENVYIVEQLTFSQDGTVDIVASEHPCDTEGRSKIVNSILNSGFTIF